MVKNLRKLGVYILIAALILCTALAVVSLPQHGGASAESDSSKFGVSFKSSEDYGFFDEFTQSANMPNAATPKDSDIVDVVITLPGYSMLEFATQNAMSVAEALGTEEGQDNLAKLEEYKKAAYNAIGNYIIDCGYRYTTAFNGFSARIKYGDFNKIKSSAHVKSVILGNSYLVPEAVTENNVQVDVTGIYDASGIEYDGTGTVIAVLDTGTDYTHEVFDMELNAATVALSKNDIANVLGQLSATSLSAANNEALDVNDVYRNTKLPFSYDYADKDADVFPVESHGTHVAGIVAGKSNEITGVAVKAQIATFKVFPDANEGAKTEDILAAVNDAVLLGVDAINMSLGSACGFSSEEADEEVNRIYGAVNEAGICLVVACGNNYSSAFGSKWGNTNLASNPDSGTISSPASYEASLAIASISGVKTRYFVTDEGQEVYFNESRLLGKSDPNDFVKGILGDKAEGTFDYVLIPGVGLSVNYTGIDVTGKIALVRRGTNSFEEKVRIAKSKGALGVIVYNNVSGTVSMSVGTKEILPSCFITQEYAVNMVAKGEGKIHFNQGYLAGPFMSDFSCWGVLPDLQLSPDLTAHGGEIRSAVAGGDKYDVYSGTSMACPNLAGALILVRQFVKESNPSYSHTEVRDETYSRMMSTATIALNEEGNPYSPRKQGAGLADIAKSIDTKAYLTVDGSNKPKLSLGDDSERSGVYEMKFNIVNTSGQSLSYKLNPYVFTESMSSDERTVAEKAYLFNDAAKAYFVKARRGSANMNGSYLSISGYGEAEITVKITLTEENKQYLNSHFRNGMYVEGYVCLESLNNDGIDLGIPYLAFYGDWTAAPMLDVTAYQVGESAADDSVLAEDKLTADVYGTLPYVGFSSTASVTGISYWGMGQFAYIPATGYEEPLPQEKYASMTTNKDKGNYIFHSISAGLLRSAKKVDMEIRDAMTGELIWAKTEYNARKSYSQGGDQVGGYVKIDLDVNKLGLANNSKYVFNMECFLDIKDENGEYTYGKNNKFSFEFAIDDEAPVLEDLAVREVKVGTNKRYYLDMTVYDNHYLQGYSLMTFKGNSAQTSSEYKHMVDGIVPVDVERNTANTISFEITKYWNTIQANNGNVYIAFYDYAKNVSVVEAKIQKEVDVHIGKTRTAPENISMPINGQRDLIDYVSVFTNVKEIGDKVYSEGYWNEALIWEAADTEIVAVKDGVIVGKKTGNTVVTVRAPFYKGELKPEDEGTYFVKFNVAVTEETVAKEITQIELSTNVLELERGEKATIRAKIKPFSYDLPYSISWDKSGSNVEILSVSEDGLAVTVFANQSGSATVWAKVDDTRISASCAIEVRSEFVMYNNVYLRTYVGRGDKDGVVEIPDDLGIVYIYPEAFADNQYIKKVIIPDGVTTIMKQAFAQCEKLEEVVLPESVEEIGELSFYNCSALRKINLEKVKLIKEYAFGACTVLERLDLAYATFIDRYAFFACEGLTELTLPDVGAIGGGAFAMCNGLTDLVIPENVTVRYDETYEDREQNIGGVFAYCDSLQSVKVYAHSLAPYSFVGCAALIDVKFFSDMDEIGKYAFAECNNLANAEFNGTLHTLETYAFRNCYRLEKFTLPNGLEKVGMAAFFNCNIATVDVSCGTKLTAFDDYPFYGSKVTAFRTEADSRYLTAVDGVLYDYGMKKLVAYPYNRTNTTFTVPVGVKTVGKAAFSHSGNLRTVNLSGVEFIDGMAFDRSGITSVTGYDNLKYIGNRAFFGTKITKLPLSDGLIKLGDYAFAMCEALTDKEFVAPVSLAYIGDYAFTGCKLTKVSFENNTLLKTVGDGAFAANDNLVNIEFGGLKEIAPFMFAECVQLKEVVIPDTVTYLGESSFEGCTGLRSVTLSKSLTKISSGAFCNTGIASVILPDSVTAVEDRAFKQTKLTAIDLNNVETIGAEAFNATKIATVQSEKVVKLGSGAFSSDVILNKVSFPNVTIVGSEAFKDCITLSVAELKKAEIIGSGAFYGCSSLTNIELDSAKLIGGGAFESASKLTSVTLKAVEVIMESAFKGTQITSIELPNTLLSVAEKAFYGAEGLKKIEIKDSENYLSDEGVLYAKGKDESYVLAAYPAGKEAESYTLIARTVRIGENAFNGNKSLQKVVLPVYLQVIGANAFEGATALTEIKLNAVAAPILETDGGMDRGVTYNNFNFASGSENGNLTIIVPVNASGYDNRAWRIYVGKNLEISEEVHASLSTLDFIDRVKAVKETGNSEEIAALNRLYNLFDAQQKLFITGSYADSSVKIDKEYYDKLLGGRNYYNELQSARG